MMTACGVGVRLPLSRVRLGLELGLTALHTCAKRVA